MPATEYQRASFVSRSIMSMRRNQVAAIISMEAKPEDPHLHDIDLFLKHVAERFQDLSSSENDDDILFLSLPWLRKLLDLFLSCDDDFKAILLILHRNPHFDRLLSDLLDRSVKALDLCNAISLFLDSLHRSLSLAQLALSALLHTPFGPGHLRRSNKALKTLLASISPDDRDPNTAERTWSFGRRPKPGGHTSSSSSSSSSSASSSLSVSAAWSAAKQLQAMAANLAPPRGAEMSGLALPIYTMSSVLLLVTWVLAAAVPCQDRLGLMTHLPTPPRQLPWAALAIGLQERVAEEWRKKEKKGTTGLMEELQRLERCACGLVELDADQAEEMRALTNELAEICKSLEDELLPFQCQVREVFHRIVRSRTEILDYMGQATRISTTILL